LYAASDVPEIEGRDIIQLKSAPSAAHVTGKRLVSSKASTWPNEHFMPTFENFKTTIDNYLLAGVNHNFYASIHFDPSNSFWNDFETLNQYITRTQSFLQSGRSSNDCLVYFATADLWSVPVHIRQHVSATNTIFEDAALKECLEFLTNEGYSWDAISDKQLLDVSFKKQSLQTGGNDYKTIVVHVLQHMPLETFEKLLNLAKEGATILFHRQLPYYVPGFANHEKAQQKMDLLKENLSFTEKGNLRIAIYGKGQIIISDDLSYLVAAADVTPERMYVTELQCIRRIKCDGNYYYFVKNFLEEDFEGWIVLNANYKSVAIYNPMTNADGFAKTRKKNGKTEIFIQLKSNETLVIETFRGKRTGK